MRHPKPSSGLWEFFLLCILCSILSYTAVTALNALVDRYSGQDTQTINRRVDALLREQP